MNLEPTIKTFLAAVVFGMGFKLGWGVVQLVFDFLARAAGG
jgi:hypothetical protein